MHPNKIQHFNLPKRIIVVAGPTASGKTALAIDVALHFKTEILSSDSRQCYRELNIGVAKPSPAELNTVPHHFINSHSIQQKVDAAVFEQYALETLSKLFEVHDTVVVVGGTGLYIKALCEGLDKMPEVPGGIRDWVRAGYERNGLGWLQEELQQRDPVYFKTGEMLNPHRVMRALEFFLATGKSIKEFQKGMPVERPFDILKIALTLPADTLTNRINNRVDEMMKLGLAEEVKSLLPYQELQALQTVGYKELFDHFNGLSSLDAAVEFIKRSTRQYAKRQLTWFNKDPAFEWFAPVEREAILKYLESRIGN